MENGEIVRLKLQLFVFLRRLVGLLDNIEFLHLLLGFHFVELVIFVRTWQHFWIYY